MSQTTVVSCPQCGHEFPVADALASRFEEKYRTELARQVASIQSEYESKNKLLGERENQLNQKQAEIDKLVDEKLKLEREGLQRAAAQQAKEEVELLVKGLTEENEKGKKQIQELKKAQVENERLKRLIEEQRQDIELEYERKMTEQLKEETGKIRKRESEAVELKLRERDKQLADVKGQLDEMKRKAEQGSMQLQGEVQELALEELLREAFPFDTVEEIGKGVRGADCIQTVRNKCGVECGGIIYESKRTKAFSDRWISKLKADALEAKADICVIVSEALPQGLERIGQVDGVWVCSFQDVKGLAMVLRESLIHIQSVASAHVNKGEKMQMLYAYLTGNEFKMQLEAIVEGFTSLQDGYNDEKLRMQKIWKEREKQLEKVLSNTVGLYGSIKGIAGRSVPEIKMLESSTAQLSLDD